MLAKCYPFYDKDFEMLSCQIRFEPLRFFPEDVWAGMSRQAIDFIARCLVKQPKERITAAQAQVSQSDQVNHQRRLFVSVW